MGRNERRSSCFFEWFNVPNKKYTEASSADAFFICLRALGRQRVCLMRLGLEAVHRHVTSRTRDLNNEPVKVVVQLDLAPEP